jgi:hypothetical protein
MASAFVGKGLGIVSANAPAGVVTPYLLTQSGLQIETYRITTESGDQIKSESGDFLRTEA